MTWKDSIRSKEGKVEYEITTITFDVLRNRKVIVIKGESKDLNNYSQMAKEHAQEPNEAFDPRCLKDYTAITYNTSGPIVILTSTYDTGILAHEAVHAAFYLLADCGINDEEALAYHVGYIVKSILE